MTRLRPGWTWLAFVLCLAVVGGAMIWMSATVLRLEQAEQNGLRLARQSENERLALWRMESALVPLLAQENSRPYSAYRAFYSPEAYSRWFTKVEAGEVQFPSELLTSKTPHVVLHFEISPDGRVTSPQIPTGNRRDIAEEMRYTSQQDIARAEGHLRRLKTVLSRPRLLELLSVEESPLPHNGTLISSQNGEQQTQRVSPQAGVNQAPNPNAGQIAQRNTVEFEKRRQTSNQLLTEYRTLSNPSNNDKVRPMKPIWIEGQLLLARESRIQGKQYLQGCVLDWPEIRDWLQSEAVDLLPGCRLLPVTQPAVADPQSMLASIPVQLHTESIPTEPQSPWTPVRLTLGVSWLCFLLAAAAVAMLLFAALRLSERRGAFVSAVTHELRTPLTTFRMYTDMLSRGMVSSEKQTQYVETLQREAERLGHLVENVLSYARLESPKKRPVQEEFSLSAVLTRLREILQRRAAECDMILDVSQDDLSSPDVIVRADSAAVERILFNLVDNACKYARHADDRRIHLNFRTENSLALLHIRDHGPGVPPQVERRMFLPFSKSDKEAANSAPGVGLGLSLSRGLARSMGGDLTLDRSITDGAAFTLTLPLNGKA